MWDRRFGGNDWDAITCLFQTKDGGYFLGGYSRSGISGDKTQPCWSATGSFDFWIVKVDSLGNKEWDKTYGGTNDDRIFSACETSDGGYILGGYSLSGIGGNKTKVNWGDYDYWIVKVDSSGNMLWDQDFGGSGLDFLHSLQETDDHGFILGGLSMSGISGNKTTPTWGPNNTDFWVIKSDSLGNKQWEKDFGGTSQEHLYTLTQTTDKGFLFGGTSQSGISGDKSQPNWDTAAAPSRDYWILKTDSMGNKQWDKDIGGTASEWLNSLQQTPDGGYILGGQSWSGVSGNKTQPVWGFQDYWIVKIDSLGNIQWDKDFGGLGDEDEFGNITPTLDGGYLLAGFTWSNAGGDKTENNLGFTQMWIVKTDSSGNKDWDKTIFTSGNDLLSYGIQTKDGCYLFANYTNAGVSGYKTETCRGSYDFWITKFCDSTFMQANFSAPDLCPGSCTDFINLSFNANSYQWNFPGAVPDTSTAANPTNICYANPGTYDVQLIASNANGSDTLLLTNYIIVYPFPPPQSITQSGDTLFAIAGATTYQWYFNTNLINGATDYFYVASSSGDYNVVATDGNGCEVEAAVFNVLASAQAAVGSSSMQVFPNPTHDKVTIQKSQVASGTAIEISIYNMMGEIIRNRYTDSRTKNQELTIDVSQLPPGMYWLEIKSGEKIFRSKFIKAGNR